MPQAALDHGRRDADDLGAQRASEARRMALLLAGAGIAFIAGRLGGAGAVGSWVQAAASLAIIVVAFLVAVALLRFVDALALHHRIGEHRERSRTLARDTRETLEKRFSGVANRAREVDARTLIDRALSRETGSRSDTNVNT